MRISPLCCMVVGVTGLAIAPYLPWSRLVGVTSSDVVAQQVVYADPSSADAPRNFFANGVVEGRSREIDLLFELSGRLAEIRVAEGQIVEAGDVLARLDDATWQQELAQAEASLQLARTERVRLLNGERAETRAIAEAEVHVAAVRADQAISNFQRSAKLVESKAISTQEFEQNETDYRRTQAELRLAQTRAADVKAPARADDLQICDAKIAVEEARVSYAKTMLDKTVLRAPIHGMVLKVEAEVGEMVGASPATGRSTLITMVDNQEIRVRAYVEELDAVQIDPQMTVHVTADGVPGQQFVAHVLSCAPIMGTKRQLSHDPHERIDVKVREVVLRLDDLQPLGDLVIGLPVEVRFSGSGENVPQKLAQILP